MALLRTGQKIQSPVTHFSYEILAPLGEGGFGQAYQAYRLSSPRKREDIVCFKASKHQDGWIRESYFGTLLANQPRVIQLYDTFSRPATIEGRPTMLYCLVSELAEHGTIDQYLDSTGNRPWPATQAKKEITALLKVLNLIHGGSATHRDLTPMNVFVCDGPTLKLGDFGIARHNLFGKQPVVTAFNPAFVTQNFRGLPTDDVYQMGQILAYLLTGKAWDLVNPAVIAEMRCGEALKTILRRAIGPRKQRYADAFEMLEALENRDSTAATPLRSLKGKCVVFTGPLSIRRMDAEVLVLQAGGSVARHVTRKTDVVVVGGKSPHYIAGHKGVKLKDIVRLNKQGAKISIIGESEFRRITR